MYAGLRAAVPHRDAEPLRAADRDVGAQLAGRGQQGHRQQIRGDDGQRAAGVRSRDHRSQVPHLAAGAWVLRQHAEELPVRLRLDQLGRDPAGHQRDPERLGPGGQDRQRLRQAVGVGQEHAALAAGPARQRHRLGGGGRLVEHGRACDRQRSQVLDHGLEVEQRLQPALGDLRLIRRVGRVPGRVLQHVAPDHRRSVRPVVAKADHRGGDGVHARQPPQLGEGLVLRERRRQAQLVVGGDPGGQRRRGQLVQRGVADEVQHPGLAELSGTYMTGCEIHGSLPRRAARPQACGDGLPLCQPRGGQPRAGFRVRTPPGPGCLRGSGEVAPSAPRAGCAKTLPVGVYQRH